MAEKYVTRVRTDEGDLQIDYNALANKPTFSDFGAAAANHTHKSSEILNLPTSLPADGGNADTVDGYHASSFASSVHKHTKSEITDFPTSLPANGGNAATLGGQPASAFATTSSVSGLNTSIGTLNANLNALQTNLNGKADVIHSHSIENMSGILPVSKGGTGFDNGADGLRNLFASGETILTEGLDYQYYTSLPEAGKKGRIFFKKVSS